MKTAASTSLINPDADRERLVAAHEDAADFYRRMLLGPAGDGPRRYLVDRGFGALLDDTGWTVGYAPPGWTRLRDHLTALGYSDGTLFAAGLTHRTRRGTTIDCFRGRITFGIRDIDHTLVGFTARSAPDTRGQTPKYLNTRTTAIYDKSRLLFGLGETIRKSPRAESGTVVLTEGPLDAIAVDLSQDRNSTSLAALALCGTAISAHHRTAILAMGTRQVVLAFDADPAGARARENAYPIIRDAMEVDALADFDGPDLADMFQRSGPASLNALLQATGPAIDVIIEARLAQWPNPSRNAETSVACLRDLASLLSDLAPSDMARQTTRLSQATDLPAATVIRELTEAVVTPRSPRMPPRCTSGDRLPSV